MTSPLDINLQGMTTAASGLFTVTLGTMPNSTYAWRVKGPTFLANWGEVSLTGAPIASVECGLMVTGDADNDNVVDVSDFLILKLTFGQSVGDPGYDDRADFTGDNTVDVSDFNLLKGSFGHLGAPPLSPGG